jgi:O-antigen chain-terminating methyltransferase
VATHTFHHDPTHGNPLTPTSLEFLVNHHGLETVAVLRLHPYPPEARLPGNDPASERSTHDVGGRISLSWRKTPPG